MKCFKGYARQAIRQAVIKQTSNRIANCVYNIRLLHSLESPKWCMSSSTQVGYELEGSEENIRFTKCQIKCCITVRAVTRRLIGGGVHIHIFGSARRISFFMSVANKRNSSGRTEYMNIPTPQLSF